MGEKHLFSLLSCSPLNLSKEIYMNDILEIGFVRDKKIQEGINFFGRKFEEQLARKKLTLFSNFVIIATKLTFMQIGMNEHEALTEAQFNVSNEYHIPLFDIKKLGRTEIG
jgi:hypothetical protein